MEIKSWKLESEKEGESIFNFKKDILEKINKKINLIKKQEKPNNNFEFLKGVITEKDEIAPSYINLLYPKYIVTVNN